MCTAQERLEMLAFKAHYTPTKATAHFSVKSRPIHHLYAYYLVYLIIFSLLRGC